MSHPLFRNVTRQEAESILAKAPVGEVLLCPGSLVQLGNGIVAELSISWRVADGIFQHLPLGEAERPRGQDWLLGRKLYLPAILGNKQQLDRFEDVDEIVGRRIEPIVGLLQEAQMCPKYLRISGEGHEAAMAQIKHHLRSQAQANPSRTPYCLSLSVRVPGSLLLSHPGGHELVKVDPRGFVLVKGPGGEEEVFERLERMIDYFKRNYQRFVRVNSESEKNSVRDEDPRNKYQQFMN